MDNEYVDNMDDMETVENKETVSPPPSPIDPMASFDLSVIYTRPDGSYVVNQGLYHVPNDGSWSGLWKRVDTYAKEHPDVVKAEPTPPEPTPEEKAAALQKHYTDLIQRILDTEAQKLGYDNCNSVCTYVDTGVQKFDDEGRAFRKWRSEVWALGYELLAEVQAGTRPVPTEAELVELLPKLEIVYES